MNDDKQTLAAVELTTIIKRYLADIDKLKSDLKLTRQIFDDAFKNDVNYAKEEEKVKAASRERNAVKQSITKKPEVETVTAKIRQIREEIKAAQEALSGYLYEYQRVSGATTIEDNEGEVLQIIPTYRLKKKSKI